MNFPTRQYTLSRNSVKDLMILRATTGFSGQIYVVEVLFFKLK